jgi:hypothetical protein
MHLPCPRCGNDNQGKTAFNGQFVLLPPNHPLRTLACDLHNHDPEAGERSPAEASGLRFRSHTEMARQVKSRPEEALLVAGERERPFPGAPRRHQGGGSRRLCVRPVGLVML